MQADPPAADTGGTPSGAAPSAAVAPWRPGTGAAPVRRRRGSRSYVVIVFGGERLRVFVCTLVVIVINLTVILVILSLRK